MTPIIGDLIESTLGKVVEGGLDIIKRLIPDKGEQLKVENEFRALMLGAEREMRAQEHAEKMAQVEVNKIEAASTNIFVAGWRPSIGWTCALSLFWTFVGYDVTRFFLVVLNSPIVPPQLVGSEHLMELVFAMLGLAGFRTYEKQRNL
jgi:hypothetical protein